MENLECSCTNCEAVLVFESDRLGETVKCPKCDVEVVLCANQTSLSPRINCETTGNAKLLKEMLRSLQKECHIRERIPDELYKGLLSQKFTNQVILLEFIRTNYPQLILSKNYARQKVERERMSREIDQIGEYAPEISIGIPERSARDTENATPAQLRYLRDMGVRNEAMLAILGKYQASELIDRAKNFRANLHAQPGTSKSGCFSILVVCFALTGLIGACLLR